MRDWPAFSKAEFSPRQGATALEEREGTWRTNGMGVVNQPRRIYPLMCDNGHGKIVALGSIAAKIRPVRPYWPLRLT